MAGRDLACGTKVAAAQGAWLVFEDEAGQTLRSPRGRTWGRRGHTPVVKVCAASSGRVSIAGLVATKPDRPSRLIFRTRVYRGRKKEKKGFTEPDYAALLDAAHQQLGGPIVLVWDNLNTHLSGVMSRLIEARDWLTVYPLPSYTPRAQPGRGGVIPPQT